MFSSLEKRLEIEALEEIQEKALTEHEEYTSP
jgi:hypothetical protein